MCLLLWRGDTAISAGKQLDMLPMGSPPPLELSPVQEYELFLAVARRVIARVCGEKGPSTSTCLGPLADAAVFGAFVSLKRDRELRSCCGFVRPNLPLADALDNAALRAAADDPRFPSIARGELDRLDMDVWLLWGARTVMCRGDDRATSVDIGRHGVQITHGCHRGLLLPSVAVEHGLDARALLNAVCVKAGLPPDAWREADTELVLFEGRALHGKLVREGAVRPAACAGSFYPGTPGEIEHAVDAMLNKTQVAPEPWAAALVPHAGWMYSGSLAAKTLARVQFPSRAIVFCPRHHPLGAAWAVMPHARWELPGGGIDADPALAAQLAAGIDNLELDAAAHREEHAIEVQLPLIARLGPATRIVGIALGRRSGLAELLHFGRQLAAVVATLAERPLLVISSDMNHGADDATTRRLDRLAITAMEALDPAQLYQTVERNHITMCGVGPAVVVLECLRQLGLLQRGELVGYATSADAGSSPHHCVGYAGMLFGKGDKEQRR